MDVEAHGKRYSSSLGHWISATGDNYDPVEPPPGYTAAGLPLRGAARFTGHLPHETHVRVSEEDVRRLMDENDKVALQKAMANRQITMLPSPNHEGYRPDGFYMRFLRVVAYIFVIITCAALLLALVDLYIWMGHVQEAFDSWSRGIAGSGLLGD